jgi:hypothetical protein
LGIGDIEEDMELIGHGRSEGAVCGIDGEIEGVRVDHGANESWLADYLILMT